MSKLFLKNQRGFVATPIVIGLSILMIAVGLLAATSSYNIITASAEAADSSRAFFYAESAAKELLGLVSINRDYCGETCHSSMPLTYDLDFSGDGTGCVAPFNGCASVRLEKEPNSSGIVRSPRIITVTGRYKAATRKIQYDAVFSQFGELDYVGQVEIKALPTASSGAPSAVGTTGVRLNGWTNPNNNTVNVWFNRYTSNPLFCSDATGTRVPGSGNASPHVEGTPFTGINPVGFYADDSGLTNDTVYYYCAVVGNGASTTDCTVVGASCVYGNVYSFRTNP